MEKIVILGNGGHAKSLVDIIEREKRYEIAGYVVNENNSEMPDVKYPRLGGDAQLEQIFQSGITNAAVGVGYMGNSGLREKLWEQLKQIGFSLPVICDPSAVLAGNVKSGRAVLSAKAVLSMPMPP